MKYLTAIFCLLLCYQLSIQKPHPHGKHGKHHMIMEKCMESSGVTKEELKEIKQSKEKYTQILNGEGDFKNFGCFIACVLQEEGQMQGTSFNITMNDRFVSSEESDEKMANFIKVRDDCIATAEGAGDECDVALAFDVCMEKAFHTHEPS